jgi:hypothetical protein
MVMVGNDGRSSWGGEFEVDIDADGCDAFEQTNYCRCRVGQYAVGGCDRADTDGDWGAGHDVDAK